MFADEATDGYLYHLELQVVEYNDRGEFTRVRYERTRYCAITARYAEVLRERLEAETEFDSYAGTVTVVLRDPQGRVVPPPVSAKSGSYATLPF